MTGTGLVPAMAVLLVLSSAALWDLHRVEGGSITIYTTPALRDLIEKSILPRWTSLGGERAEPVYVAAGEQFNRLRVSGGRPEADVFMHASPLYIAKGYAEGYFLPIQPTLEQKVNASLHGVDVGGGAAAWYAFAWSPLVTVYRPSLGEAPDIATADLRFGLPHPTLSNNGIYAASFLEAVSPEAGVRIRDHTVVQPVNARTNIVGVADGSFDVTLGYEAVAKFFMKQGAKVSYDTPTVDGRMVSTPVLFSVGLVDGPHPELSRRFTEFLFENETQALMATHHFRSIYDKVEAPDPDAEMIRFDWNNYAALEANLPQYEVTH